jgi:hypothetical protein
MPANGRPINSIPVFVPVARGKIRQNRQPGAIA